MQKLRIIVLSCQWETIPPGTVVPAPISPSVLQQMFSESAGTNWSLADLFVRSTLGHVIGYSHSFGSDLTGDKNTEYGDPYCIMSARTFGGTHPQASGSPPGVTVPAGLPATMWDGCGPLAAAAVTVYYFPTFNTFPNVVEISSIYHAYPQYTRLVALSEATMSDPVLARVNTGLQSFFIEYRAGVGWDRGLAQPGSPSPAVVIHRRKPSSGALISYAGCIPLPFAGAMHHWTALDDDFQVDIVVPPSGSPSEVVISVSGCFGSALLTAFIANNSSNDVLVTSSRSEVNWSNNTSINQTSKSGPALAVFGGKLWIAFIANNPSNDVLVASSSDGINWSGNTSINQTSKSAPALVNVLRSAGRIA